MNPAKVFVRPLPQLSRPMNQVGAIRGNRRVIAFQMNAVPPRGQGNLQTVGQRDGLVNGPDFMVAIRALGEDFQAEIDFGESADSDRGSQWRCCEWAFAGDSTSEVPQRWADFSLARFALSSSSCFCSCAACSASKSLPAASGHSFRARSQASSASRLRPSCRYRCPRCS